MRSNELSECNSEANVRKYLEPDLVILRAEGGLEEDEKKKFSECQFDLI
jgi:hypothetical protein